MNKYAIFIDLDGTLRNENGVHHRNAAVIATARQMGHLVFVNSGRARSYINADLLGNIEFDGIISGMGSHIEIGGKTVFEKYIDQSIVYEAAKHFWNTKYCFLIGGLEKRFALNPLERYLCWDFETIHAPEDFLNPSWNDKIQKIELYGTNISTGDKEFLSKKLPLCEHEEYIECGCSGLSKASAMDYVLRYVNVKKEYSIAIGDSSNDADMLKNAGISVAMGNASDEVRRIADFVSLNCENGGVGYAIEKIVFNEMTRDK